jgi:hypothetical protein
VELPPPTPEDLRWRASPVRTEEWQEWFSSQLSLTTKVGLFAQYSTRTHAPTHPPTHPPMLTLGKKTLTNLQSSEKGLFVGLRLDGRVRASGQGMPPWARFEAELGPMTGGRGLHMRMCVRL